MSRLTIFSFFIVTNSSNVRWLNVGRAGRASRSPRPEVCQSAESWRHPAPFRLGAPRTTLTGVSGAKSSRLRRALPWLLFGGAALGLGALALLAALASLFTDTSLDRSDFASDAQAAEFVSEHLPAPLPASVRVEKLSYDRWTDWRLSASVELPSVQATEAYLKRARAARATNDEYCLTSGNAQVLQYFLAKWYACGSIQRQSPRTLLIGCNTR